MRTIEKQVKRLRKGAMVKVMRSQPDPGQEGIDHLVGETFEVLCVVNEEDEYDGRISVNAEKFGGPITLNPEEYSIV